MQVKPYKSSGDDKKTQVAGMFNSIARQYDFLNHFLSFGIDRYWRRKAIQALKDINPSAQIILDAATGTGDLAIATAKSFNRKPIPELVVAPVITSNSITDELKIFGIDISEDMLAIGRKKIKKKHLADTIELLTGDSEKLFFDDNKFDAVTVAFGVRNFENLAAGLKEFHRVLKPGGCAVILEFSYPTHPIIKKLYRFYSTYIMSKIGKSISKDDAAYSYLYESIEAFPSGDKLLNILQAAGFKETKFKQLTFGIASIYTGKK